MMHIPNGAQSSASALSTQTTESINSKILLPRKSRSLLMKRHYVWAVVSAGLIVGLSYVVYVLMSAPLPKTQVVHIPKVQNALAAPNVSTQASIPQTEKQVDVPVLSKSFSEAAPKSNRVGSSTIPQPSKTSSFSREQIQIKTKQNYDEVAQLQQTADVKYQQGELIAAKQINENILRHDSSNLYALNSLGLIALRENQFAEAQKRFHHVLQLDPENGFALSYLSLIEQSDNVLQQSLAKLRLKHVPESSANYLALANLYMREGHWQDARQTFFDAHVLNPHDPDILYNLAICLEQLRQPMLALQYYRQALKAAEFSPAAFDRTIAQQRVAQLESL